MAEENLTIKIGQTGAEVAGTKIKEVTRSVKELQDAMTKGFTVGARVSGSGSIFDPTVIKSSGEAMKDAGRAAKEAGGNFQDAASALTFFQKVFVAREIVKFTEAIEDLSDTFTNLQNKMKVLSENEGAGGSVESRMRAILDIAEKTGQPLDAVSTGFFRISEATKEMGANTAQVSRVMLTLNEAMAVSGATSVEAKNGMIQLTQGLSLGVVKGQDLRAVISDIPTIGRLIADHFKVSIGVLRDMASQGKVTATEVMQALLEGSEQMDTKFGKMGETFERAWNTFKTKGIDAFAPILEATNGFTTAIDRLGDMFDGMFIIVKFMGQGLDQFIQNFKDFWQWILDKQNALKNFDPVSHTSGVAKSISKRSFTVDEMGNPIEDTSGSASNANGFDPQKFALLMHQGQVAQGKVPTGDANGPTPITPVLNYWEKVWAEFDKEQQKLVDLRNKQRAENNGDLNAPLKSLAPPTKVRGNTAADLIRELQDGLDVLQTGVLQIRSLTGTTAENMAAITKPSDLSEKFGTSGKKTKFGTEIGNPFALAGPEDVAIMKQLETTLDKLGKDNKASPQQVEAMRDIIAQQVGIVSGKKEQAAQEAIITKNLQDQVAEQVKLIDAQQQLTQSLVPFAAQKERIAALEKLLSSPEDIQQNHDDLVAMGKPAENVSDTITQARIEIQLLTAEMNPLADAFKQVSSTMVQGFADAIAQAIVLNKNLGELLNSLVKVVAQQAIAGLITAGIGGVANGGTGLIGLINGNVFGEGADAGQASGAAGLFAGTSVQPGQSSGSIGAFLTKGGAAENPALDSATQDAITGFASGGYTGNYGTNTPVGIVHGQEGVLNAGAMRNLGKANLDAMNAGYSPSGNGGTKVIINNNAPAVDVSASVNQSGHIEVLIQKKIAEMAPNVIASQISQSNSPVSKSLSRHIDANRRNV